MLALTGEARLGSLAALLFCTSCQRVESSPPELAGASDAGMPRPCLAQSHPMVAQVITPPVSRLLALDTSGGSAIPLIDGGFIYGGAWSPDGRSIAFRRQPLSMPGQSIDSELGLLEPDGGGEAVLDVHAQIGLDGIGRRYAGAPSWSPDGTELAFASLRDSGYYRSWVISRYGGQLRLLLPELVDAPHAYPSWSPVEARQLAYVAVFDGASSLWLVDLESREHTRLTPVDLDGMETPRWSPDGRRLAFSAVELDGKTREPIARDIFVIDVESRSIDPVTRDPFNERDAAWLPDGAGLIVASTRPVVEGELTPSTNLWRLTLDGTEPVPLTNQRSHVFGVDWVRSSPCTGSIR